ncbi:preprotein translocase subunit Sec61beta [Ignisphaera sp. 4213-co]|uniref:Preprotein translocase subunit SecG n=1 Tax=Ignisphaera cupida TaxID=3050454 RepID=A0ABD4Z3B2_9CREN|nr:preprotein translocase subunit Sec61beta [Ignisphaera sp. 4213-co]MDK6027817.1 preprotein translocase subunit Sec61beta [Ignisphaera sp. 4213-co]
MSSRRRRAGPGLASYVGLIRFYEEVEEQIKLNPYLILFIAIATSILAIALTKLFPPPV